MQGTTVFFLSHLFCCSAFHTAFVSWMVSLPFMASFVFMQVRTRKKVSEDVELVDMRPPGVGSTIEEVESVVEEAREVVLDQPSKVTEGTLSSPPLLIFSTSLSPTVSAGEPIRIIPRHTMLSCPRKGLPVCRHDM